MIFLWSKYEKIIFQYLDVISINSHKTTYKEIRKTSLERVWMNVDTILRDNDLLQIAEIDGARFRKTGSGYHSACPIHKGDNQSAFSIWEEDGKTRWHCFTGSCGGGDLIDYVIARDNVDFKRACEILGGKESTTEEIKAATEERRIRAEAYEKKKRDEYQRALDELKRARAWEKYYQNLESNDMARQLWRDRGVPDDWQNIWQLGYCPEFTYYTDEGKHNSPSLTIPIFTNDYQPVNIRHRILNPFKPNDKYRPDMPGLKSLPFVADNDRKDHECVLVVEGEIKAMVTYIYLDSVKWQVYGIAGKEQYRDLAEKLKGRKVWLLFDPDALDQAKAAARIIGDGRIINVPMKIDDALNGGYLKTNDLRHLLKNARGINA